VVIAMFGFAMPGFSYSFLIVIESEGYPPAWIQTGQPGTTPDLISWMQLAGKLIGFDLALKMLLKKK